VERGRAGRDLDRLAGHLRLRAPRRGLDVGADLGIPDGRRPVLVGSAARRRGVELVHRLVQPVYLRYRHGESFQRGPWNLGRHYRWINLGAMFFVLVTVIALNLPFTNAAVPWNDNFDSTALNYTPFVLLVGIVVAVWWAVSAKDRYTGPVRTIETDELGRVIEEPAPAAGGAE
jgi:hypothetical protein